MNSLLVPLIHYITWNNITLVSPDQEIPANESDCPVGSEETEVSTAQLINLMETTENLTTEQQEALVELRNIEAPTLKICIASEDEFEDGSEEERR